jgi:KaiC/GvpD/RAD55 family RecA-like ATPase
MNRIKSGIPGFDAIAGGGLIPGSVNMVTGETGTGKTIFGSQFLWEGLQRGESCVYITLEERPEDIKDDVTSFGWDFSIFEKKGLFKIIYHDPAQVNNIGTVIASELRDIKAKRLVIDAISIIGLSIDDPPQIRKRILGLINTIKQQDHCTTLLLSEVESGKENVLSRFGVEEFVVDGVVVLYYTGIGGEEGSNIQVRKMRRTKHNRGFFPLKFSEKGLTVGKEGISELMK